MQGGSWLRLDFERHIFPSSRGMQIILRNRREGCITCFEEMAKAARMGSGKGGEAIVWTGKW